MDDGDKLTSITQGLATVKSFTYDAQGRTTGITTASGTTTMSYDYEDRITGIGYPSTATSSFAYNAFDTRVAKSDSAGTASFMRDGVGVTDSVLSDGSSSFTPGVSQRSGATSTFQAMDRLGTFKVETNASQSVTGTRQYDAFGNPTGATGTPTTPFGFAGAWGYQQDPDSGLMLLGHRYYDPSTGRFLTRDPAKDGRNWYGYCFGDPIGFVDPDGNLGLPEPIPPPGLTLVEGGGAAGVGALGTMALVAGTAIGGWMLGRWIDDQLGISQWIGERIVGYQDELPPDPIGGGKKGRKGAEHTEGARPSTKGKHQLGKARKKRDRRGGEKGDDRRPHVILPPRRHDSDDFPIGQPESGIRKGGTMVWN